MMFDTVTRLRSLRWRDRRTSANATAKQFERRLAPGQSHPIPLHSSTPIQVEKETDDEEHTTD
jgi:hypothetical protein